MTGSDQHDGNGASSSAGRRRERFGVTALTLIAAILIGATLQFAAVAKVTLALRDIETLEADRAAQAAGMAGTVDPDSLTYLLEPGTVFENGLLLDMAIGVGEFAFVLVLLAAWRRRYIWLLVALMFGAFSGFALQRAIADVSCGCFGALWEPPRGFSLVIDVVFLLLALTIAGLRGVHRGVVVGTLVLSLGAGVGGYIYAARTAPPSADAIAETHAGRSAPDRLLALPMMEEVVATGPDGPAWYVFVYDPTCSTCQAMLPVVEFQRDQFEMEGNPFAQVKIVEKGRLSREHGIESYAWDTSPTVLIVRGGDVVHTYGGEGSPFPSDVADVVASDLPLGSLD